MGQIYLLANPLLREPLRIEHTKPRLLGHWGTTPGLNFVYAHLNRVIRVRDLNAIYVAGPGHGGPGLVANVYLEGTYSEVYPHIGHDEEGLRRLFRQFSFPGGIPSHVAPETPGSIHEGGELGYSLAHAFGAAFDNPDLLVCCVVGDGEAETGPLAASWHSNKFLNPARDGAVLPVLHLNGYKIANPTVLARIPETELRALLEGYGYAPRFVDGRRACGDAPADGRHARRGRRGDRRDPARRTREHGPRQGSCRLERRARGPHGPARPATLADDRAAHAQGLDGSQGGRRAAGRGLVPLPPGAARRPRRQSPSTWRSWRRGCAPIGPRSCSTSTARYGPSWRRSRRTASGAWAPTRTPTAACCCATWRCPTSATTPSRCEQPGTGTSEATRVLGGFLREVDAQQRRELPPVGPDETASNRLGAVFEVTDRAVGGAGARRATITSRRTGA